MSDLPKMPMPARTLYGPNRTADGHYFTADQMRAYAQAALNARAGGDGWLPIESAPNRERVLVCGGDVHYVCIAESDPGRYQQAPVTDRQEWYQVGQRGGGRIWPHPTHWQPLPTPPAALASQAVGVGS